MKDVIVITDNTTIPLTIKWIKELTFHAANQPEIQQVAREAIQTSDPEKYIFDYSYDRIVYEPNQGNKQQLRTAYNFLREGKGNCTTYVTLIGAALLLAGIPFKYRIVNYPTKDKNTGEIIYPEEYQHIYIVTASRKALDPVIGHRQDGTDTRYNRPSVGQYNIELPFYKKIDIPMTRLEILQGTLGSVNPEFKKLITNRTKLARYGLLGCNTGCNGNGQLDGLFKKLAAKILPKTDVGQVIKHIEETAPQVAQTLNTDRLKDDLTTMAEENTKKLLIVAATTAAAAATAGAAGGAIAATTPKVPLSPISPILKSVKVPDNLIDLYNSVSDKVQKGIMTVEQVANQYPELTSYIKSSIENQYGPSTGIGSKWPPLINDFPVPSNGSSSQSSQQSTQPSKRELIKAYGRTKVIRRYV